MNQPHQPPRRRPAGAHRRRRRRARRAVAGVAVLMAVAGGIGFALPRLAAADSALPASSSPAPASAVSAAASAPEAPLPAESALPAEGEENAASAAPAGALTAAEAQAMLDDPLMILVNHTTPMPEDYTFETKECGSSTAINKTLQTAACDAFLAMQQAAAADGVTLWMQSGYRSVAYQSQLYDRKTAYYREQGYDEATAREMAAAVVNPPGYSEHNCGLAADLNCPEYTVLDEGFEDTAAFRWLCEHAGDYGFILRYPQGAEATTEITYEPWHWRYVGAENAARINASGLCFEDYIAYLQRIVAES